MRYLSLFSGIEAATAAWKPLGWQAVAFAEIEPFPRAVLAHHYPAVPNWGDATKFKEWPDAAADVVIGGSPCQSFSVAGLRKGMDDPRGNLALTLLAIVDRYKPKWIVYENVPGLLSSGGGRDFGSLVGGMVQLGYGVCWRILDAQFFGLAQRRRRVFVVGHLGDWRRAAAVLFEPEGLRGDTPPSREAGQGITYDIAPCLGASGRGFERTGDPRGQDAVVAFGGNNTAGPIDIATAVNAHGGPHGRLDFESETFITRTMDGTGRSTPLVPVAFSCKDHGADAGALAPTLRAMGHAAVTVALHGREGGGTAELGGEVSTALRASQGGGDKPHVLTSAATFGLELGNQGSGRNVGWHGLHKPFRTLDTGSVPGIAGPSAVRRLTPVECERLQGFPDDFTLVPYRGKPASDGPRYKALGNSMAVPVVHWIGRRIALLEDALRAAA